MPVGKRVKVLEDFRYLSVDLCAADEGESNRLFLGCAIDGSGRFSATGFENFRQKVGIRIILKICLQ